MSAAECEVLRTPFDKARGMPRESKRRSSGADPKQPALWAMRQGLDLPPAVVGQFPKGFVGAVLPLLGVSAREVLHMCSGSLSAAEVQGGIRVDIRPTQKPDIAADARRLPFGDGAFGAVLVDPPYSVEYARELYGVEYPRPSALLAEASRVVRAGGVVAILHFFVPAAPAGLALQTVLGVTTGVGYRIRALTLYRREQVPML